MNSRQIVTIGTVLRRTDFQEADRILTLLTPDQGKVRVLAKGVRRAKSKLAGGIELLSISDITYIPGRGELGTLISARMLTYYDAIVTNLARTMLAYDFIKIINKITEDPAGEEYFNLIKLALTGLNDLELSKNLVELWFSMQLLKITGHEPNLSTDKTGKKFESNLDYLFSFDDMAFEVRKDGPHSANLIKLLRLAYATDNPLVLGNIQKTEDLADAAVSLIKPLIQSAFGL